MNIITQYFTNHRNYTNPTKIKPAGIMVHDTGADNPNIKRYVPGNEIIGYNQYNNHWDKADQVECVHAFIGKLADGGVGTVNVLPWTYRAYHCGGTANNTHISFEICRDYYDKDYFAKAYQEAAELCAYLCMLFGLDPLTDILCHSEGYKKGIASNHADVMEWFPYYGKSMDTFRTYVSELIYKEDSGMNVEEWLASTQDNDASEWSAEARQWAIDNGLAAGGGTLENGETNYMWESPLTREQFYQVLYRMHLNGWF